MCGICGYLDLSGAPADPRIAEAMAEAIAHRGPEGQGVYSDGPLALGHRRLAILDLSDSGRQPMITPGGRFVIVYNGEVYNFRELRRELETRGHAFLSRTDTEVVLAAWAEWGPAALDRFNGMFAFAIWDRKDGTLWLARDRYGIKPLYWTRTGQSVVFGSEIKALLAHPGTSATLDASGLVEYLSFQNFFSERTLFDGIEILRAGHWLRIGRHGATEQRKYWAWDFQELETAVSEEDHIEELDRLFVQAVTRQLVADVPISAYLSGGLDSGAITAVAARREAGMRSFTIGFDSRSASGLELVTDERPEAEHMSYHFGTEHYEMVLKAGDMQRALPRMAFHLEEPRVGQSYPNFYASQLASRFGKVVLAGSGGDELFGGYPWRYYRAVVNDDFEHYADKYFTYWQRLVPDDMFPRLVAPLVSGCGVATPREVFRRTLSDGRRDSPMSPEEYVNASLAFEARTFLHGLLVVDDKLSMAHGLETRVPFLDNDLVDFAMRLPVRFKLGNLEKVVRLNENDPGPKTARYFRKTRDGKLLLRKAMIRHVPAETAGGIKRGFSGPDESWFRGESIEYVRGLLLDGNAWIWSVLDRATGQRLIEDHLSGRANRRLLLWSLLSIEEWSRIFLSATGTSSSPTQVGAA